MGGLTLGQEDFLIGKSLMGTQQFEVEILTIFECLKNPADVLPRIGYRVCKKILKKLNK